MKITDILEKNKTTLSFEVFPPKTSDKYESVERATAEIAKMRPDFMSVTYGAGGGTSQFTVSIASNLKNNCGVTPLAHLTCVSSDRETVRTRLDELSAAGIENILALRGDIPKDAPAKTEWHYHHASELMSEIAARGDFCIGGACYPEGHPESKNLDEDIENLKRKLDAGCSFLTTQMFFDNYQFYRFMEKARCAGIYVPIIAGIMPITNAKSIRRSCELSGTEMPRKFLNIVDRFGDDPDSMMEAGITYACAQIIDLFANGVKNVHVYTMNKPEVAARIRHDLAHIIPVHE
ncbi:MAG: methylenetetrahydrofolate reductase [Clostridia bacterium]|nr:methylenetetrahydrofolate reductase [NAD(P)H] [Clostridia bacterium]